MIKILEDHTHSVSNQVMLNRRKNLIINDLRKKITLHSIYQFGPLKIQIPLLRYPELTIKTHLIQLHH